ncbi:YitT family protein [Paenibacillus koleovorans]|uniref:YitT family protein n=1 Tax=Paenibacillus koleovorans TaxID=121608 RepID=UPI000FD91398|nr:YitT family protein [Paenibacillus koleovorans]
MVHHAKLQLRKLLPIFLGTAIYAFGLYYFVIPNELMEGGVTGIALLLNYAFQLPTSITTLVLNIPLFIIGWRSFGGRSMLYTIIGTLSLSLFLRLMEVAIARGWIVPFQSTQDYFLATLYAGVTLGAGLGIVFRYGATTGGTDIIARLLARKNRWSIGQVILTVDVLVIGASLLYLPKEKVLYTLVAVFIASRIIDFITEGAYAARAFTIITDRPAEIASTITRVMDRGVTLFPARGAYSNTSKEVVYCVVSRSELHTLQQIVKSIDPLAFIVITDVHDVLGEGFRTGDKH